MPTPHYGQPRYRVIADELRERIESGAIPPGTLLPAESVLISEFRAARGTVRKAIAALREEGLAVTEHGRGTYAASHAHNHADQPETRQRKIPADAHLAALFEVEVGTTLVERVTVVRRGEQVDKVIRTYRPGPNDS
ncbi:GntR family transcriptional regulator [Micromonospora mirobrigensis]|uniref:GntR family transcriptional regulator n=1 Tax=Micromonospora mirobrigensis TaxID=262898 RepID=UPI00159F15C1|nr:GntR family transcriptional regulator [Micromonospora mirobrigensis]